MPIPPSCFQNTTESDERLVENWRRSYALLLKYAPPQVISVAAAAPSSSIDNKLSDNNKLHWLFKEYSSFSSGYRYIYDLNASYLRIWKAGNDAIRFNLEASYGKRGSKEYMPRASRIHQSKCIFTFVRDPVQHFISGYNEYEFRAMSDLNSTAHCEHCIYDKFPKGSEERFWGFLLDFLSFNFLKCSNDRCQNINVEIRHVFPMSGVLKSYSRVDFVGSIENMVDDWRGLHTECLHTSKCQSFSIDKSIGLHKSSSDPYGLYTTAKNVVRESQVVREILRSILEEDYRCFGGEAVV